MLNATQTEFVARFSTASQMGDHTTPPLPAHQTKHFHILRYPINHDLTLSLLQLDDGKANGTGLWLGAQCLSLFLANKLKRPLNSSVARPKVVELGSGIGLTAWVHLLLNISDSLIVCL